MNCFMELPLTAQGFYQVQVHVDYSSGKVYVVPFRSTDIAADAAKHIIDIDLRSGDGKPVVLVVDHDPKLTSTLFSSRGASAPVFSLGQRSTTISYAKRLRKSESLACWGMFGYPTLCSPSTSRSGYWVAI